jgi:hypothetical protein
VGKVKVKRVEVEVKRVEVCREIEIIREIVKKR